jgi:hypothetical protein
MIFGIYLPNFGPYGEARGLANLASGMCYLPFLHRRCRWSQPLGVKPLAKSLNTYRRQ